MITDTMKIATILMRGLQNLVEEGETDNLQRVGDELYWPFDVQEVVGVHTHHSRHSDGVWFRLKDGRVFNAWGEEDDPNPSLSHGKATAYLPVIDLLHAYSGLEPGDDMGRRREKVGGKVLMLDRSLEDTLPYLFALLGLSEGDDQTVQVGPQVRRRRMHEAIKRVFLRESLNQPLTLIFEDLHWMDDGSQGLLNLLVDSLSLPLQLW